MARSTATAIAKAGSSQALRGPREQSSAERPAKAARMVLSAPNSPSGLRHPTSDEDEDGPAAMIMVDAVNTTFGGGATGATA
jgi:hypothetical protein